MLVVAIGATALAPEVLAFPHRQVIGDTVVYSDAPLPATLPGVVARSDALLRKSAIYGPSYGHRLFLTDGGWRWRVLALQSSGAFALSWPGRDTIVINRSEVARDRVTNGALVAGTRGLSGVIAHERTHGLIRKRYGLFADFAYPAWLREGYCDVVAGGGSLSDADAARLKAEHRTVPALLYFDGRKRVEEMLRAKGGSVDAVFAAVKKGE
ncbi:hypothetical protein U1872_17435 [Sphingomonas sp. RB3P16]|uniref:hypothetical protein n=1 Tax=Parasphingomonas frigoris TaxID=3096163 RepID=UPI002FC8F5FC